MYVTAASLVAGESEELVKANRSFDHLHLTVMKSASIDFCLRLLLHGFVVLLLGEENQLVHVKYSLVWNVNET